MFAGIAGTLVGKVNQFLQHLIFGLGLFTAGLIHAQSNAQINERINSPHATVELFSTVAKIKAGETFDVGFRFQMEPGWHIYWKNPGDSGTSLQLSWEVPGALLPSDIKWPVPRRIPVGPLANYGYENDVLLPVSIGWRAPAEWSGEDLAAKSLKLQVRAEWLICKVECLPADGKFEIEIPVVRDVGATTEPSAQRHLFEKIVYPFGNRIETKFENLSATYLLSFEAPEELRGRAVQWDFLAGEGLRVQHAAEVTSETQGDVVTLTIAKDPGAPGDLSNLRGLVLAQGESAQDVVAFEIDAVRGEVRQSNHSLPWLLLFAFVGGLILNVMPCVFPVLSLKVLSFVHQASQTTDGARRRLRRHGWAFAGGVWVSFMGLAGLLLLLRAQGEALGWGFQLQSPGFVAALALLFFVIGLNFLNFFEISFSGGRLATVGAGEEGYLSSFLSGALATLVATPCTAPLMGVALGAALVLDAPAALLIFSMLAWGMAFPYVLLSHRPQWLNFLPRPGAWMETLRQALAFPVLATSVWLLWVLQQQAADTVIGVIALALLLTFWIWLARQISVRGRLAKFIAHALVLAAIGWVGQGLVESWRGPHTTGVAGATDGWSPFIADTFAEELAQNEYVFVDFTASWCITCQVNKKIALNTSVTKSFFAEHNIKALRADWTARDPSITQHLEALGRRSVPTYAIYHKQSRNFALLPEILSEDLLQSQILRFVNAQQPQQQTEGTTK